MFTPNRIAVYLTVLAGIAGAVAPVVADMDWTSVAGVVAGLGAVVAAVVKWLDGWQKYEQRQGDRSVVNWYDQAGSHEPPNDADDSVHEITDGDPAGLRPNDREAGEL